MMRTPTPRRAFTLLELLIVLTVIALLAAMGFTAIQALRPRMEINTCASQLAQFGRAGLQYANDWSSLLPSKVQYRGDASGGLAGEAEFFFTSYLLMDITRYRMNTLANLSTYGKCPAMLKLKPDYKSGIQAYNYVYRATRQAHYSWGNHFSEEVLSTRQSARRFILFCGSSGYANGSDISEWSRDPGPQFPHLVNPDVIDLQSNYRVWDSTGKVNVLRVDGSVALLAWLKNQNDPKYDASRDILLAGPTGGTANWHEAYRTWYGRENP